MFILLRRSLLFVLLIIAGMAWSADGPGMATTVHSQVNGRDMRFVTWTPTSPPHGAEVTAARLPVNPAAHLPGPSPRRVSGDADGLPMATLSGRLHARDGSGVGSVTVAISGPLSIDLLTNGDGRFDHPLPEGDYEVQVVAPGFAPLDQSLSLTAAGIVLDLEILRQHLTVTPDQLDLVSTLGSATTGEVVLTNDGEVPLTIDLGTARNLTISGVCHPALTDLGRMGWRFGLPGNRTQGVGGRMVGELRFRVPRNEDGAATITWIRRGPMSSTGVTLAGLARAGYSTDGGVTWDDRDIIPCTEWASSGYDFSGFPELDFHLIFDSGDGPDLNPTGWEVADLWVNDSKVQTFTGVAIVEPAQLVLAPGASTTAQVVTDSALPLGSATTMVLVASDDRSQPVHQIPLTVTITRGGNHAPTLSPVTRTIGVDELVDVGIPAKDLDGDPLDFAIVSGATHGVASLTGARLRYQPDSGYLGGDAVVVAASDGLVSVQTTVSFTVAQLDPQWTMNGNGPAHQGQARAKLAPFHDPVPIWSQNFGSKPPVIAQGRVFIANHHELTAFDAGSGSVAWSRSWIEESMPKDLSDPTYADGSIFIQTEERGDDIPPVLLRLSATSGETQWSSPFVPTSSRWLSSRRYLSPCVAAGKVYVGGGWTGGMYGFDVATGIERFYTTLNHASDEWTPCFAEGILFSWIGGYSGHLTAHDPDTGAALWSVTCTRTEPGYERSVYRTPIAGGGFIFVSGLALQAIDIATHEIRWSTEDTYGQPAFRDGVVYASNKSSMSGAIDAIDAVTGEILMTYGSSTWATPVLADDGLVSARLDQTVFFAYGDPEPRIILPGGNHVALAGRLLVIADDTTVRAYSLAIEPEVYPASVSLPEDSAVVYDATVLNASASAAILVVETPPSHGQVDLLGPRQWRYRPAPDFTGADRFTLVAGDGTLTGASTVVELTVTPVNDPPTLHTGDVVTGRNTSAAVPLTVEDIDGDALTLLLTQSPRHGTVEFPTQLTCRYVPAADWSGSDDFALAVSDGSLSSASVPVQVVVATERTTPTETAATADGNGCTAGAGMALLVGLLALGFRRRRNAERP